MLVLLSQKVELADIIANAVSIRIRGKGYQGSDNHPGLFPSAED